MPDHYSTAVLVAVIAGVAIPAFLLLLALFEPGLQYRVVRGRQAPLGSAEFARTLGVVADAQVHGGTRVEVLTNGKCFYETELQAIIHARHHVHLEAYIFQKGEIAGRFIDALAEKARAGVEVRVVLDAIGSFNTWRSTFRGLLEAGGRVEWYQTFRWYNLGRLNNRTHRELLIVDGTVAFLGGAGIADHWYHGSKGHSPWRDTMFRVEGPAVTSLQATLTENWLEASDELLAGEDYFPPDNVLGQATAMVVNSTPSVGRATRARILFQVLIASARRSISITTPYFLPDRSARCELVRAVRRGVDVRILVPGRHSDHFLTRRSSRRVYGELLQAGARIWEYRPSMIHAKVLIVDGIWSVVGSTNFDYRSFGLNDEVNLAALDDGVAARLEADFAADLAKSSAVTYADWRRRPVHERVSECFGWLLERQQ